MATIVVAAHEHDRFHAQHYMVGGLIPHWIDAGHFVVVHEGKGPVPAADVAFLHVDLTVVPDGYLRALEGHRVVVNGGTKNIAKRAFSEHLVTRDADYRGPVIVKTDLNFGGVPELDHAMEARRSGGALLPPRRVMRGRYPIYPSPLEVPEDVWLDSELVVQKFLPEKDERGYYLRTWIFLGDRERCNRIRGKHPIVKAVDAEERVPVPVPDELRAWRERTGFDYGKFDFAIHEGAPVLYDINRTPSIPANFSEAVNAGMAELAGGIEAFLR